MNDKFDKIRIGVLVSGGGTNLEAIFKSIDSGDLIHGEVKLVISSKADAFALERAKKRNIRNLYIEKDGFEKAVLQLFEEEKIDMVVLAGFLKILSGDFIKRFKKPIINIHPSLIPAFCGKGCYGIKVHEQALQYGVKVTGATVHFVSEVVDGGKIIDQKAVMIRPEDDAVSLQKRVMEEAEWIILPRAIENISKQILKNRSK